MKKKIFLLPLLALVLAGCTPTTPPVDECDKTTDPNCPGYVEPVEPGPVEPETLTITTTGSGSLTVGDELSLKATVNPDDAEYGDVMWSTDQSAVATVRTASATNTKDARVTAVGEGTAIITAKVLDSKGGEISSTFSVIVKAKVIPPTPKRVIDDLYNLETSPKGTDVAGLKGYVVVANNNGLVIGDDSGYILVYNGNTGGRIAGISEGDTVRITSGETSIYSASAQIIKAGGVGVEKITNVVDLIDPATLPAAVDVTAETITEYWPTGIVYDDITTKSLVKPLRGNFSNIENFASGNFINQKLAGTDIALAFQPSISSLAAGSFVSFDGFLLGIGSTSAPGRINIYAVESSMNLTYPGGAPTAIDVTPDTVTVEVGQSLAALVPTFTPVDAFAGVTYASDVATIATVSREGVIRGVGEGTANITITSQADASITKVVAVTVTPVAVPPEPPVEGIKYLTLDFSANVFADPIPTNYTKQYADDLTFLEDIKSFADDSTKITAANLLKDGVSDPSGARVYLGNGNGGAPFALADGQGLLKVGSSSTAGEFSITLPDVTVTKIVVVAAPWQSTDDTIVFNGGEPVAMPRIATPTLETYTVYTGDTTEGAPAVITTNLRARYQSIEFYVEEGEVTPPSEEGTINVDFTGRTGASAEITANHTDVYKSFAGTGASSISAVEQTGRIYQGDTAASPGLLKCGTSAARDVTLKFTFVAGVNVKAVTIVGQSWGGNANPTNEFATVSVNGGTGQELTSTYSVSPSTSNPVPTTAIPTTLDFTVNPTSNVITITNAGSNARMIIYSISFIY